MNDALTQLIQNGRERFAADLGATGQNFDAPTWDVTHLARQLVRSRHVYLHFVRYGAEGPLPCIYAEVVKSWLLLTRASSVENLTVNLLVARVLWEALLQRRGGQAADFRWESLGTADLDAAETLMRQRWAASTTHQSATRLVKLATFLAARAICLPVRYLPQTPRQRDLNNHTLAGQEARRAKLPSSRALDGLAALYAGAAVEPPDRLRLAAVALLVVTGLRVGELLTLPLDCEVHECRDEKDYYGLRYHREKAGYGAETGAVHWLSPAQAQLAQAAVAEIRALTAAARERAQVLEQQPDRVPLPGYAPDDWLNTRQIAAVFSWNTPQGLPEQLKALPHRVEQKRYLYRAGDLEKYLLKWRVTPLWTVRTGPTSVQKLSETLLLAFRNGFQPGKATWALLVEPLTIQVLNTFLGGHASSLSIFQRMSICEAHGQPCRVTTHQFRHWLNDLADKGGLPVETLTRWMGRSDARDTQDYRHATVDERLAWLKDNLRSGAVTGFMAEVYRTLPAAEVPISRWRRHTRRTSIRWTWAVWRQPSAVSARRSTTTACRATSSRRRSASVSAMP
jgi:integrase